MRIQLPLMIRCTIVVSVVFFLVAPQIKFTKQQKYAEILQRVLGEYTILIHSVVPSDLDPPLAVFTQPSAYHARLVQVSRNRYNIYIII